MRASIRRGNSNIEHEREVAIFDILEATASTLDGRDDGPYTLVLSIVEDRLVFAVAQEATPRHLHVRALAHPAAPHHEGLLHRLRDLLPGDPHRAARRASRPSTWAGARCTTKAGKVLIERLKGKITVDNDTARRLFTLICALHWKG
jgi:uncharacterized protein (UPF0262 family)